MRRGVETILTENSPKNWIVVVLHSGQIGWQNPFKRPIIFLKMLTIKIFFINVKKFKRIQNWVHSNAIWVQFFFNDVDVEKCYFCLSKPFRNSFVTPLLHNMTIVSCTFYYWTTHFVKLKLRKCLINPGHFYFRPRATLKGPERSFVVVVGVVETWAKNS